ASFRAWRAKQVEFADNPAGAPSRAEAHVSDDEIRAAIGNGQLKLQQERGSDLTLFSPIAGLMSHHLGNERTALEWAEVSNDLVRRVCDLYPDNFAPVCQLPQVPGAAPKNSVPELRRCVEEMGFVGCNLFMQLLQGDLFKDFPTLRLVIPHGGGAVPYHWGRYRGMSLEMANRPLEGLLDNIFFDTCVYHHPGVELLTKVVPTSNVLFGSEMIGAVRGTDPNTGHYFDDTKRYLDACTALSDADRLAIFEGNARRVYPRLDAQLNARGKRLGAVLETA
ncbi:MAG: amidohydrolase family protein, partial [Stenotrophomonas sp.]